MNVFPGKQLTVPVRFEVGGDPVSPTIAAYRVVDQSLTEVVPNTSVTVPPGATSVYVIIPSTAHTALNVGEKYRPLRLEVSFTADGGVFEKYYMYYVVPDLFLSFDDVNARLLLGLSEGDFTGISIDYYRAYIELATGPIGDDFYNAIIGSDPDMATVARNLVFYAALRSLVPSVQMGTFKSLESETSKVTRFDVDYERYAAYIDQQYSLYYSQIALISTPQTAPTLLVLDAPTDAITGV